MSEDEVLWHDSYLALWRSSFEMGLVSTLLFPYYVISIASDDNDINTTPSNTLPASSTVFWILLRSSLAMRKPDAAPSSPCVMTHCTIITSQCSGENEMIHYQPSSICSNTDCFLNLSPLEARIYCHVGEEKIDRRSSGKKTRGANDKGKTSHLYRLLVELLNILGYSAAFATQEDSY